MTTVQSPEIGQAVRIRNRLATVRSVSAHDNLDGSGRTHIIEIEYLDDRQQVERETLLWELEPSAMALGTSALPTIGEHVPDHPSALRPFVNAHRWARLNRLESANDIDHEPLLGVWSSAVQVHPYQIVPVIRALQMPRVSLLLADGVGLGKTIQAGLVLQELLLRRRVRRILILCPALLQRQWKSELKRKFNMEFEIVDSDSTFEIRKRFGMDTNPWKAFPRIITSMDFLRMADIRQQFLQGSGEGPDAERGNGKDVPYAPWDLLIVDEAHNFAPQNSRRSSQRHQMLTEIRFLFEHRIFLTATPHNGRTVSFTGLLELLDPVRFQIRPQMTDVDHVNLEDTKIRRLKDDIKRCTLHAPFADFLPPAEIPINLIDKEAALYDSVREYRKAGEKHLEESGTAAERWIGHFVFSVLTKRLLSCPFAFARTWWRHVERTPDDAQEDLFSLTKTASERSEDVSANDSERSVAEADLSRYGGAWLRQRRNAFEAAQVKVGAALEALGYSRSAIEVDDEDLKIAGLIDSKTEALVQWVKKNLFTNGKQLRNDERLIIFTEYRETLEFLRQRFVKEGFDENTMLLLFGGMGTAEFKSVQEQFEDETAPVRLLLATDAASEGINLQDQCRWIIHFDIPWSPTKLQQRNGRVWRHGQLRDVQIHYFRCDQDEDLDFLLKVAQKVETVREDLGSVEQVFDQALQNHFRGRKTDLIVLDTEIKEARKQSSENEDVPAEGEDKIIAADQQASRMLEHTQTALGITPAALEAILRTAVMVEGQGELTSISGKPGFFYLDPPPSWESLVKEQLTVGRGQHRPQLVFDENLVTEEISGRRLLRLKKHQVLLRLGHPVMQRAMSVLKRQLHEPYGLNPIRRWTVAAVQKSNFEALAVLHYTITVTNELREPLHDEVFSEVFRVEGSRLQVVDPDFRKTMLAERPLPIKSEARRDQWWRTLRLKWDDHWAELDKYMLKRQSELATQFEKVAAEALKKNQKSTKEAYDIRLKALDESRRGKELEKVAQQITEAEVVASQQTFFEDINVTRERRVMELKEILEVLQLNVEETKRRLEREQKMRLEKLLPARFTIRDVRVLPLAVEYLIQPTAEDLA